MRKPHITMAVSLLTAIWLIGLSSGYAAEIKAEVVPSNLTPVPGERISVSINLDMAGTAEQLGAVAATLTWNPEVLRYLDLSGGTTEGFAKPVANDKKSSEGRLVFASMNPYGGAGAVNLLNLNFEVIGAAGSAPGLQMEVTEMVAARTFVDLLPMLATTIAGVTGEFGVVDIPKEYKLQQNYPNPFNAGTQIRYALPQAGSVTLAIYNALGERVRILIDDELKEAGRYHANWDGTNQSGRPVTSGIYIYRLQAGSFTAERKMLFVK